MAWLLDRYHQMDRRQRQSFWINWVIAAGVFLILIAILSSIKVGGYYLYKDKTAGFKIRYPATWVLHAYPEGGAEVAFTTPAELLDKFIENVNVDVQNLDGPTTLTAYSDKAMKQLEITLGGGIKVLNTGPAILSGRPAFRYIYEGVAAPDGDPIRFMHVWTVDGSKAYVITYAAQKSSYNKYVRDVEGIIGSFRIL